MTDPIQQQRITARKNQILDAAAVVFAEKGFHPATIRDVAQQAGIADGTIYNYFESKPALLIGIFERMRAAIIQAHGPALAEATDTRAFVRTMLQQPLMAIQPDNFALFRIILSEMMVNEELRTLYREQILEPTLVMAESYLAEATQKGALHLTNPGVTVRAISGMVMGLMLHHIMGDSTLAERWEELPDLLTDLILNGLKAKE